MNRAQTTHSIIHRTGFRLTVDPERWRDSSVLSLRCECHQIYTMRTGHTHSGLSTPVDRPSIQPQSIQLSCTGKRNVSVDDSRRCKGYRRHLAVLCPIVAPQVDRLSQTKVQFSQNGLDHLGRESWLIGHGRHLSDTTARMETRQCNLVPTPANDFAISKNR